MKQKLHGTNIQQSVSGKPDIGERHPPMGQASHKGPVFRIGDEVSVTKTSRS